MSYTFIFRRCGDLPVATCCRVMGVSTSHLVEDPVVQGQELGRPGHQPLTLRSERDPAGRSNKERHSAFEPGDVATERLLCDVQAGCGPPKVQLLGHGEEVPEQPGVDVADEPLQRVGRADPS
jgi:hypothetical protein